MMLMDEQSKDYELQDRGRRLYKLGVCTPLGYCGDWGFKKPKSIPSHFSKVRRADISDFEFLKEKMGDLSLGKLRSGEEVVDFNVCMSGKAFASHVGVFATTGMGKSNLMKALAASNISSGRYGLLILDPHGEYYGGGGEKHLKGLKHHLMAEKRLETYSARKLDGSYNSIVISAHEISVRDIRNLYDFSQPQIELLYAISGRYGKNWLVKVGDASMESLITEFEGFHEGTINVIKRRAEAILHHDFVSRDDSISITKNVISSLRSGKTVLVDTSNLFEQQELLIGTVLTRSIFQNNKNLYGTSPKEFNSMHPILITLEEAQRVLSSSKGSVFAQIAREGRKFKTGLCAISQQPKLIHNEVISQFNTLFILGLADKRDRDILRDSAKQDIATLDNEIQMLMPGEAIIASPYTDFALPVKIHLYEEYLDALEKEKPDQASNKKPKQDQSFF
jgi:DNA helicase HerA-like ATPase